MSEIRYFTEHQMHHMINRLDWMTVKELKKLCPYLEIKATWYNKANKHHLKWAILLRLDICGMNEEFFTTWIYHKSPYYWKDCAIQPDHTTQFFVRGETATYERATEAKSWRSYFPINTSTHKGGSPYSSTLMDQRHHPHREWPGAEDPENLIEPYVPKTKLDPTWVTLHGTSSDPLTGPIPVKEPVMANTDPLNIQAPVPLTGGLEGIMTELIKGALADKVEGVLDERGLTRDAVVEVCRDVINDKALPKTISIPQPVVGGPTLELVHQNFEAAEFWLSYNYSVYLNGPSGSGKTVAATQLAKRFSGILTIISCHGEMTVYDLTGFTDGNGQYRQTEFFKAWRDGNMILMDEVDKAPGEVNVLLNAALAQGTITFPVGTLEKKETTKLLFTGNTKMSGADAIYSAGQRQDASFSNRMISIEWPFDLALEQTLAETESEKHGGSKLMGKDAHMQIIRIREKIDEMGMNYVVGQRQSMMLAAAVGTGRALSTVLDEVVYGWMDPNDAERVRTAVGT